MTDSTDPSKAPADKKPSPGTASSSSDQPLDPPAKMMGMIRFIGPGLIVAGSIVGSGELIATTKT